MLRFNFANLARMRSDRAPRRFLMDLGLNHVLAAKLLQGEAQSIRLSQLETICEALRCTPNDLLEWKPDGSRSLDPDHPLRSLRSMHLQDRLADKLRSMSVSELEAFLAEGSGARSRD